MITLQQLIYFKKLSETCQLTNTAESLYISQTTLSNTINNLEKQLGIELFTHVGRNIELSYAGKKYLEFVNIALIALNDGQATINDLKEDNDQSISVAFTSSNVWLPLIHDFKKTNHNYKIKQVDCGIDLFRQKLLEQSVDYVIAGIGDFLSKELNCEVIRKEKLYVCVNKENKFASKTEIDIRELDNEPMINLPSSSAFRLYCDKIFSEANIRNNSVLECDYTLRGKLIESGFGIALTTSASKEINLFSHNLVYIPVINASQERVIAIYWNPKHYLTRAATDFKKYVLATKGGKYKI